jgi:hypothetical protein
VALQARKRRLHFNTSGDRFRLGLMSVVAPSGWPIVVMGAELLRKRSDQLLAWLTGHSSTFSLVVDATGSVAPPEIPCSAEWLSAFARCERVAVCVGRSATLGIVWHHRLRALGDAERRLFIDFERALAWAGEPYELAPARTSWVSVAPPLRPSVF